MRDRQAVRCQLNIPHGDIQSHTVTVTHGHTHTHTEAFEGHSISIGSTN